MIWRALFANPLPWLGIAVLTLVGHLWLASVKNDVSWIAGGGASVIVIGIVITAAPIIGSSIAAEVQSRLPRYRGVFPTPHGEAKRFRDRVDRLRPRIKLEVWAERIIGVWVIVVGTLVNGYSCFIARALSVSGCGERWTSTRFRPRPIGTPGKGNTERRFAIYLHMAEDDPSLDGGSLAHAIGECYEKLGDLHAARYWYGRAAGENPGIELYRRDFARMSTVRVEDLVGS